MCHSLTSITIPASVTRIWDDAFYGCYSLKNITIPEGVTSIGEGAFRLCHGLTSITVESGNSNYYSAGNCLIETATNTLILGCGSSVIPKSVTRIGEYAFICCESLKSITIPENVTSIGECAFNSCSFLTSVVIPGSVTSIEFGAFSWCNYLTNVYYGGTEAEWSEIGVDENNSKLISATIYYYSKTESTGEGNYWHYDEDGVPTAW